jgi:hypothetical protein
MTKIAPAMNSTKGYCHEILLLQPRHFPLCTKKLKIGNSSSQVKVLPHDIHFDLPPRVMPVLKRSETTFKKLPTIDPKRNATMVVYISTILLIKLLVYFGPTQYSVVLLQVKLGEYPVGKVVRPLDVAELGPSNFT